MDSRLICFFGSHVYRERYIPFTYIVTRPSSFGRILGMDFYPYTVHDFRAISDSDIHESYLTMYVGLILCGRCLPKVFAEETRKGENLVLSDLLSLRQSIQNEDATIKKENEAALLKIQEEITILNLKEKALNGLEAIGSNSRRRYYL